MTVDEAIKQAQSEMMSVRAIQAENIGWCLIRQLRPEWTRDRIEREVGSLTVVLEEILR